MAAISDIAQVTISLETVQITEDGFGTPMVADYHTVFPERIRFYSRPSELISDGFAVTSAAYKAAAAIASQSPRPAQFAIGRRSAASDLEIDVTPTAANSRVYTLFVHTNNASNADAVAQISFTSDSTATVAEITAGLAAATAAALTAAGVSGITVTDNTTKVTVKASVAGRYFSVRVNDPALMTIAQVNADPGLSADLAAIQAENPSFYGVLITSNSDAEILAGATFAEANNKLFFAQSQNTDNISATVNLAGTDIANELRAATRLRTALLFHERPHEFASAAWMGRFFGRAPGKINAANKNLAGVSMSPLSATSITNLTNKNANFYVEYGGTGRTRLGKVSGNEWIDFIRDRDWLKTRMETETARPILASDKLPFTDGGIAVVAGAVRATLNEAADAGFLVRESIVVDAPLASEVSPSNKAARILATITWSAQAQGAINVAVISGTVTV
jgi:hypothetical protein